jgi:hypothetical protein
MDAARTTIDDIWQENQDLKLRLNIYRLQVESLRRSPDNGMDPVVPPAS